jgi:hypothetical protein
LRRHHGTTFFESDLAVSSQTEMSFAEHTVLSTPARRQDVCRAAGHGHDRADRVSRHNRWDQRRIDHHKVLCVPQDERSGIDASRAIAERSGAAEVIGDQPVEIQEGQALTAPRLEPGTCCRVLRRQPENGIRVPPIDTFSATRPGTRTNTAGLPPAWMFLAESRKWGVQTNMWGGALAPNTREPPTPISVEAAPVGQPSLQFQPPARDGRRVPIRFGRTRGERLTG